MYLIFYDISSDSIRNKMAKRLIAEGYERIQLSVFAGLPNPKSNTLLWQNLNDWITADTTALLFILKVPPFNFSAMTMLGENQLDIPFLLGEKNSIFI